MDLNENYEKLSENRRTMQEERSKRVSCSKVHKLTKLNVFNEIHREKYETIPKTDGCRSNKLKLLFFFILAIYHINLLRWYLYPEITQEAVKIDTVESTVHVDTVAMEDNFPPCQIEPWNNLTMDSMPYESLRNEWIKEDVGGWTNLNNNQLRVLSAFVYKDEIVVTTTTQNRYRKKVYCRYFDCNRVEIPNSTYESIMFPVSAAYCVRRAGARFMALTDTSNETTVDSVPLIFRAFDKPVHELSVCVGPIYGEEVRWIEIVETTEHHILMGFNYFYFSIYNKIDPHTRRLLDHYEQVGTAELTVIQSEYEPMDWMFHMLQINDCFFRARHHSKWILNVDIDERLIMTQMPLRSFLTSLPDDVGEISFSTARFPRTKKLPAGFTGIGNLKTQLLFLNINQSVWKGFSELKGMARPDKTEALFYHWAWMQYPGIRIFSAPRKVGFIKHYRSTLPSSGRADWHHREKGFTSSKFDSRFEKKLLAAIFRRVERVYDQRMMWCEEVVPHMLQRFPRDNYHCLWKRNGTLFGY